jgi:hypothetical protein
MSLPHCRGQFETFRTENFRGIPTVKPGWKKLITAAGSAETECAGMTSWLNSCLQRNAATEYGRAYGFENILDEDDYRERIPLADYDDFEPFFREILTGASNVLFEGNPVAFEKTGGSSGGGKIIPYSRESLRDFRNALLPWIASLLKAYGLGEGKVYLAVSPALRAARATSPGVPLGLPDGAYLGKDASDAVSELSAVPPEAAGLSCFDEWQLATLYYLLRTSDLEMISVWSPTFLSALLDGIGLRKTELTALFRNGGRVGGLDVPSDELARQRLESYDGSNASTLWPELKLVSCWTDASSAPYAAALAERVPHAAVQGKGLLLTEGVVTVPDPLGRPLPALGSGFFEFLDQNGDSRLYDELDEGEAYEVVMTTSGGLYRYRAGDLVRCAGHAENLPILRFAGRCGIFSDLAGEKLSDAFVMECLALAGCSGILVSRCLPEPGYMLFSEEEYGAEKIAELEAALRRNPQYSYARDMRQLLPLEGRNLKNMTERYIDYAAGRGKRLGDIKIPALCTDPEWAKEAQKG